MHDTSSGKGELPVSEWRTEMEYKEKKRSLFFGLPLSFTTYTVTDTKINIKKGLLRTVEDDTLLYKVQDVKLVRGIFERIFKLGTIICYSGDVTDAKLMLSHIRNASEIKEFILLTSETERRKVRTVHTMELDAEDYAGEDEMDDYR